MIWISNVLKLKNEALKLKNELLCETSLKNEGALKIKIEAFLRDFLQK